MPEYKVDLAFCDRIGKEIAYKLRSEASRDKSTLIANLNDQSVIRQIYLEEIYSSVLGHSIWPKDMK